MGLGRSIPWPSGRVAPDLERAVCVGVTWWMLWNSPGQSGRAAVPALSETALFARPRQLTPACRQPPLLTAGPMLGQITSRPQHTPGRA